jgi:hypothetical protein
MYGEGMGQQSGESYEMGKALETFCLLKICMHGVRALRSRIVIGQCMRMCFLFDLSADAFS